MEYDEILTNFQEILARFQAGNPDDLKKAVDKLEEASCDAARATLAAATAYYASADEKGERIKNRILLLSKQKESYQSKIDAFKQPLIAATVAGDNASLQKIKASMKALEADKQQIFDELELLKSSHFSGDSELYDAVFVKDEYHAKLRANYLKAQDETWKVARAMVERWENIEERTLNWESRGGGSRLNLEKLEKHYHFDEWEKEEAAERETAKAKAGAKKVRDARTAVYRG